MLKIIFFGTSQFATPILKALHKNYEVVLVVTTPDSLVGRKQVLTPPPIANEASSFGINIIKPEKLKTNNELFNQIRVLKPDIGIVAAYGKIIPADIISIPKHHILNIHPSLLPKYRGPSPIQYALLNGEIETGTTIMLMDEQVDHGSIVAQTNISIDPTDNFIMLQDKLSMLSTNLLLNTLEDFVSGKIKPTSQNHDQATFTKILKKEDGKIDWQKSSSDIYNQFRAFISWPGIWTTWHGQVVKILDCIPDAQSKIKNLLPGIVLTDGRVVCGDQTVLEIKQLQLAGKTVIDISSFIRGHKDFIGSSLS